MIPSPHFSGSHFPTRKIFYMLKVVVVRPFGGSLSMSVSFYTVAGRWSAILLSVGASPCSRGGQFLLLVAKVVQPSRCAIYDRGSTFWAQCLWWGSSAIVSEELLTNDVVGTPFVFYYSAVVVFIPIYLEIICIELHFYCSSTLIVFPRYTAELLN